MESTKIDPQRFRAAYGDKAAQSDYDFLRLALNTTPGNIRLVDSREDVARKTTLLLLKVLIAPGDSVFSRCRQMNSKDSSTVIQASIPRG